MTKQEISEHVRRTKECLRIEADKAGIPVEQAFALYNRYLYKGAHHSEFTFEEQRLMYKLRMFDPGGGANCYGGIYSSPFVDLYGRGRPRKILPYGYGWQHPILYVIYWRIESLRFAIRRMMRKERT